MHTWLCEPHALSTGGATHRSAAVLPAHGVRPRPPPHTHTHTQNARDRHTACGPAPFASACPSRGRPGRGEALRSARGPGPAGRTAARPGRLASATPSSFQEIVKSPESVLGRATRAAICQGSPASVSRRRSEPAGTSARASEPPPRRSGPGSRVGGRGRHHGTLCPPRAPLRPRAARDARPVRSWSLGQMRPWSGATVWSQGQLQRRRHRR